MWLWRVECPAGWQPEEVYSPMETLSLLRTVHLALGTVQPPRLIYVTFLRAPSVRGRVLQLGHQPIWHLSRS